MKDIPLYNTFKKINPINKGFSSDKKYYVETNVGDRYLLRISDSSEYSLKKEEFESMKSIIRNGVPLSTPVDFGYCDNGRSVYTLLKWILGVEVKSSITNMSENDQFLLGMKAGKILKNIHEYIPNKQLGNWFDKYYSVIKPRIEAYKFEGIPFDGADRILNYLEDNKHLLSNRPQCRHHGDYHIGNMIITDEGELFIIDWHTVDFMNIGDPWYEFNHIDTRYPVFASDQISGYFDGNIPTDFWKLFAFYISASAITSIVWAKYYSPESMDEILNKNHDILIWFENMDNPIPIWFKTMKNT